MFLKEESLMQKVGVALSGGGAKGFAHIGFLKALEENGLYPDIVTGTSMGGILGGFYAYGISPSMMENFVSNMDVNMFLEKQGSLSRFFSQGKEKRLFRYARAGIAMRSLLSDKPVDSGRKIRNFIYMVTGDADFSKLKIPFACIAVDIISGSKITFTEGKLADALYATMALPPFLEPLRYKDMILVDGGAVDNIPVDAARELGATKVIGVNVNERGSQKREEYKNSLEILFRMYDLMSAAFYKTLLLKSDLPIEVEVDADLLDFGKARESIKKGEEAVKSNISLIKSLWES